jgi:hypothetical protein
MANTAPITRSAKQAASQSSFINIGSTLLVIRGKEKISTLYYKANSNLDLPEEIC